MVRSLGTLVAPMASRKALKCVVAGFLGTYVSRYTDYDGYWLFGFLDFGVDPFNFDLLCEGAQGTSPLNVAHAIACAKFRQQVQKHRLPPSVVSEVELTIARTTGLQSEFAGDFVRVGQRVAVRVSVRSDLGQCFEGTANIFVAPHDPLRERRSARRA